MDPTVLQAMAKWPHVPDCYGWLGLDARGDWYLRDTQAQQAGPFASGQPGAKGSRLEHAGLVGFIGRNYTCDDRGAWYFQNGPQRVYVELESTPWVWRVSEDWHITGHDGQPAQYRALWEDEWGWVYLATDRGFGVVHSQHVPTVASALEAGVWSAGPCKRAELPGRYGYVTSPALARSGHMTLSTPAP